jgi:hypothetical protein
MSQHDAHAALFTVSTACHFPIIIKHRFDYDHEHLFEAGFQEAFTS